MHTVTPRNDAVVYIGGRLDVHGATYSRPSREINFDLI